MLVDTVETAEDALCMLDDMLMVTALCSSTADAVTVTCSRTLPMASRMESSAVTTSPEVDWMPSISRDICSVALAA